MRQLADGRRHLTDMREARAEVKRQLHCSMARQVSQAIADLGLKQQQLMQRQDALLMLCQQLLQQRHQPTFQQSSNAATFANSRASATIDGAAAGIATPAAGIRAGGPGCRRWHSAHRITSQEAEQQGPMKPSAGPVQADGHNLGRQQQQQQAVEATHDCA